MRRYNGTEQLSPGNYAYRVSYSQQFGKKVKIFDFKDDLVRIKSLIARCSDLACELKWGISHDSSQLNPDSDGSQDPALDGSQPHL